MARLTISAPSFAEAREALGNRESVKIGHNTWLTNRPGTGIAVRLHGTDVVTFHADGSATLNSGGWRSVTTRQRMNAVLPPWIRVAQKDFEWSVVDRRVGLEHSVPFADGMVVNVDN